MAKLSGQGPMMLTMKTRYALRALVAVAREPVLPMMTADIAESQDIPKKFLGQILVELVQGGFLRRRKGKKGGYLLSKPPEAITLFAVIRTLQGTISPAPCLDDPEWRCDGCENHCRLREALCESYEPYRRGLAGKTLADLMA